jgi:hypothetical protein
MSSEPSSLPSEEYIAGRERGRSAGLKSELTVRTRRIAVGAVGGGVFVALMLASPATTGLKSFSPTVALITFFAFVLLGGLAYAKAVHSYRRRMRHLRDDIVRSVMTPDDTTPEPGRLGKWWLRGSSSGTNPWEKAVEGDAYE